MFNYKNFLLMLGLLLLVVSCILIDNKVYAQTGVSTTPQLIGKARLAWNPPTQREDGTPFLPSEVSYYLLQLNGSPLETIKDTYVEKLLPYGSYSYTVIVCDLNGLCSVTSSVKRFTVKSPPKKPLYPSVKIL